MTFGDAVGPLDVVRVETASGRGARLVPALVAFCPVVGLAAAQGGYFPSAWGWASVPLLWTAAVAFASRGQLRLSRPELFFLGGLIALTSWFALSISWSVAPAVSVTEVERTVVYLAAAAAILAVTDMRASRYVLGAVVAAICVIAAFGLATRLIPDRVGIYDGTGVYRLAEPIGYWNGLGLFAAIGAIAATGFAARARLAGTRAAAAAALVLLVPTLYFTFGRAAWIALGVGTAATLAADPRRLQYLATLCLVGPAPFAAVLLASREPGLTHPGSALARAAHDGHRLALELLALGIAAAALASVAVILERRVAIPVGLRRVFAGTAAAAAVAAAAAGLAVAGGPARIVEHAYAAFTAPPPHATRDLNRRLLSFSGNGRADLWRIAWDEAAQHPLLGAGPGTYERYFLAHEPPDVSRVRDAHSLYVETLAELGPVGLGLLLVVLSTPFVALRRSRRHPLVPAAFGAYVAYVVHTGVDWDWELPAVTLAGLFCGLVVLVTARRGNSLPPLGPRARWPLTAGAVLAAAFAGVTLIGHTALSRSVSARERGDLGTAATDARRAHRLLPWSPAPWDALGRTQLAAGLVTDARRSLRKAISLDRGDWQLWYDLAAATDGRAHTRALQRAAALYPRADLASGP